MEGLSSILFCFFACSRHDASGRKLKTITLDNTEYTDGTKTYNGNLVFDKNGELEYILFDEGRILHNDGAFTFEYHLKDE